MGFEPAEPLTTRFAHERGPGEMDLNKIKIAGVPLDAVRRRFKRVADDEPIIFDDVNIAMPRGPARGARWPS